MSVLGWCQTNLSSGCNRRAELAENAAVYSNKDPARFNPIGFPSALALLPLSARCRNADKRGKALAASEVNAARQVA